MRAKVLLMLFPFLLTACVGLAYLQSLPEENRRLIERQIVLHDAELAAVFHRLENIETYLKWVIASVLATGGIVGIDKAQYYVKRRNGNIVKPREHQ